MKDEKTSVYKYTGMENLVAKENAEKIANFIRDFDNNAEKIESKSGKKLSNKDKYYLVTMAVLDTISDGTNITGNSYIITSDLLGDDIKNDIKEIDSLPDIKEYLTEKYQIQNNSGEELNGGQLSDNITWKDSLANYNKLNRKINKKG